MAGTDLGYAGYRWQCTLIRSIFIDLVKTFQERINQHAVEKIMTMFTEDAHI